MNVHSAAQFTVTANNAASYQWRFNGVNIPNATNSFLDADDLTDAGTVDVVVTAADSETTTSRGAALTLVPGTIVNLTISGYADGSSNTLTIQLFDHDKPATVANFIHYATSGAYSNLFFERLLPNFVLQSGSYDAVSRSDSTTPVDSTSAGVISIVDQYVDRFRFQPALPQHIFSEFSVGPKIHNVFGTLAMALSGGDTNSAENAFFFNLADNTKPHPPVSSVNLDDQFFTVFGRVISGSGAFDYFNHLSKGGHGVFDEGSIDADPVFTDLPVNYSGFDAPVNTNLFYADFNFPSLPAPDKTLPTVAITNVFVDPATGDVQVSGTASDNASLAWVFLSLTVQQNGDTFSPLLYGTTNWTADCGILPPWTTKAGANSLDGSGNESPSFFTSFTPQILPLLITTNGRGTVTPNNISGKTNAVGAAIPLRAVAAKGSIFTGWSIGSNRLTFNPTFTFTNLNGGTVTANFVSNDLPAGIRIVTPKANAQLTNGNVTFSGTIARTVTTPAQVTLQVYSTTGNVAVSPRYTIDNVDGNWTFAMPQEIAPGNYEAQTVIVDAKGKGTVAYQKFSVLAVVNVITEGPGTVSPVVHFLPVNRVYALRATPRPGQSFHDWSGGGSERMNSGITFVLNSANSVHNPLVLTATFVSNDLPRNAFLVTSPKPSATIYNSTETFTGTGIGLVRVAVQSFSNTIPATAVANAQLSGTNWSVTMSDLPPGAQTIVAIGYDAEGRTHQISQALTVNLFPRVAGSYTGLFNVSQSETTTTAGSISLTISTAGVASGKVLLPGVAAAFPIHTRFPLSGLLQFSPGGYAGRPLILRLQLPMSDPFAEQVSGLIGQSTWAATLNAYRNATALTTNATPSSGDYVFVFTPQNSNTNLPIGAGYALMTANTNASLVVSGMMPDNNAFVEGSTVSDTGLWSLYSIPTTYKTKGMVLGFEQILNTNQVATLPLYWTKGAVAGPYYPKGFATLAMTTTGGLRQPPADGSQYSIVFKGGTLSTPVTNTLQVVSGQFQTSANVSAIAYGTNGVVTGQFFNPQTQVTHPFQGAFVNPAIGGGGYTLDDNELTGGFSIKLIAP
ncbi:MAG TPA: peptidylprolyl isomerase [Verrucomicrobiae bacterium]|nr:peptidylprolyl isomerase [Verrucomicrobiae bacterium]